MKSKIKLFQTVADLHSKGKVELTASEKALIERETADLIRKSQQYRTAAKAPEGFSDLLLDLAKMDADEAYTRVIEFMKESEIEVEPGDGAMSEKPSPPKPPMPLDEKKEEKEEKGEDEDDEDEDEDEAEEKKPDLIKPPMPSSMGEPDEKGGGEEDKKEDKKEDKDEKKEDKEEGIKEKRENLIAQAQELDKEKRMPPGPGKVQPGKGMERKRKMLELEEEDKKGQDLDEMGMGTPMSTSVPSIQSSRSKKISVRITSDGNLVASHEDRGPLFHAVPKIGVKKNPDALKRLANKVYGLIVFDGAAVAARKCGTRLLAGVDDDIETTAGDIPPETEGVTEEADFAMSETPEDISMSDTSMDDADFDTQETPDKVEARRPVARYKRLSGIEDGVEVVTEEKLDPRSDSSSDGDDSVMKDKLPPVPTDTLKDAEFDIKSIEANYKKLYQSRAQKMAEAANKRFVEKFAKAIKVAAMRMCNNIDEHPLKAAALDTLTEDNVAFSNGDIYNPMDVATATELIELFSAEGHMAFVDHLLDKTADLMEKTPEYLDDVYKDLQNLQPAPIQVEQEKTGRRFTSRKVAKARNAAYDGNVGMPLVSGGSAAPQKLNNVREAIGETKVTRRLGSMYR